MKPAFETTVLYVKQCAPLIKDLNDELKVHLGYLALM